MRGDIVKISKDLIEISQFEGDGYMPLIKYESWRVAVLKYCDELLPQNINKFQKHNETDEVFVLLSGKCVLYLGDGKDKVEEIYQQQMEPLKIYNIKKATWHSHTLSKDAVVLIVENDSTCDGNSPEIMLTQEQKNKLELDIPLV